MAADERGNDISQVFVPITGVAAIAPTGTKIPTPTEGKNRSLTPDTKFRRLGLRTTDGAPDWSTDEDGDALEFFESGYRIPNGKTQVTCTMTLAETSQLIGELRTGLKYDADGHLAVNEGGNATSYVLWTEEVAQSGTIRRRIARNAMITSVVSQRAERGEVLGHEVTFSIGLDDQNAHYHEWIIEGTGNGATTQRGAAA